MIDLSVILPVHNEEDIISPVYNQIRKTLSKLNIQYEILLVENGSKDNSLEVITRLSNKNAHTKAIVAPQGYGSAIIKGLRLARGKFVCYMPSDGQVDVRDIPKLWKLINSNRYDVVKIRRTSRESIIRLLTSYTYSLTAMIFFGLPFLDINGDPRFFLRKHVSKLALSYKDSFIDTEFAVKAKYLKWKVYELPTKTLIRAGGESTRSIHTFIEFIKNIWKFKTGSKVGQWKKDNTT